MKFGQSFHLYQVPEWEPHYVRYDLLKEEYRKAIHNVAFLQTAPDLGDVYICVDASIDTFDAFYTSRLAFLKQIETEVRTRHGLSPHSTSPIPSLERLSRWILHDLYGSFKELQNALEKLQWYNRVNQDAIDRILAKISRRCTLAGDGYPEREARWQKLKLACNKRCLSEKSRLGDIIDCVASYRNRKGDGGREVDSAQFATATVDRYLLDRFIFSTSDYPPAAVHGYKNADAEVYLKTFGDLFSSLVQKLGDGKIAALRDADALGRLPLHYSAKYGSVCISKSILSSLTSNGIQHGMVSRDILTPDIEGYTPLHLAVIRGHAAHTRLFLDTLGRTLLGGNYIPQGDLANIFSELLRIAIGYQHHDVVNLLASRQIDINFLSSHGQTALYSAARSGNENYVSLLLEIPNIDVDICEPTHHWSPLFISSIGGHLAVVKLLLQAGANKYLKDRAGWTAAEHAAFRGYLEIATELASVDPRSDNEVLSPTPFDSEEASIPNYQADCSHLVISLGGMQNGRRITAVDLDLCSSEVPSGLAINTPYYLEVRVAEAPNIFHSVSLPFLDDRVIEPFVFRLENAEQFHINFHVFCATLTGGQKGTLLGGGTAIMRGHEHHCGEHRESLTRESTVPILEKENLHCMGTVTFTYLIAKPYSKQLYPVSPSNDPNNAGGSIELVGHRGAGQNVAERDYLQLGENTIESFKSAWKHGASSVEFDVQLTRDLEPVIYHDFSLSESGTDIPIHDLTLKQFLHVAEAPLYGRPQGAALSNENATTSGRQRNLRPRSLSGMEDHDIFEARERMKHTVDFNKKGFKPNTRGDFIQGPLATLEELLTKLPESIGFNMEIKYPRLHEAQDAGVAPVAIELNTFVDAILEKIYKLCGSRRITLSSFTPEVCILLSLKQNRYPVVFITNAGKLPVTDQEKRAASLQVAIRFAKRWKLAGLVLACETFLLCPRLIQYVKKAGLQCGSYGLLNNVPENVNIQARAGIDVLIVDRVQLIANSLKALN